MDKTLILISLLVPANLVLGQSFEPLSHTSSYKIINGEIYFETTTSTTPQPTFFERWLPFLAQSSGMLNSENSEEVDEAIINSVSGSSPPYGGGHQPYGGNVQGGGVLNLPSFSQPQNPGYASYQNPNAYQNPGTYQPQNSNSYQNPDYSSYPNQNSGYSAYHNPSLNNNQVQSPYLSNEEDNYLSSGSINVPQQVSPQSLGIPDEQKPPQQSPVLPGNNSQHLPAPLLSNNIQPPVPAFNNNAQPPMNIPQPEPVGPISYAPQPLPTGGPYVLPSNSYFNNIPNKQQYFSGLPYHPQPYVPQAPPKPRPTPPQITRTTTERPFYQFFLDWFGTTTESPFAAAFANTPFNLPPQFAQARNFNVEDDGSRSVEEREADGQKEKSSLCPKIGVWQWNGEVCIPTATSAWGCKPSDITESGKLAICRNKIFFPVGADELEK